MSPALAGPAVATNSDTVTASTAVNEPRILRFRDM
jgi:hypothetical protein